MIGFNNLGRLGRIGNQMFQYAALRGIAANAGVEYCFPFYQDEVNDGTGVMLRTELFDCFTMETTSVLNIQSIDVGRPTMFEGNFHYNEELHKRCPDWTSIWGFFQSEKYFLNVEQEIRRNFTFKDEILQPCEEMIDGLGVDEVVGLHIRRQDYLTNPNHCALDMSYYKKALKQFEYDVPVIVFSDDPAWCHEQDLFQDDRFMISENESGYIDQCLMSMCSDFIIANSSFSWWAAWLGNRGKVIAPKKWFPDDKHNLKDLYCKGWKVI